MTGVTTLSKEVEFDMGHRVPEHGSKCRNPHGHRYRVRATCSGTIVDEPGAADGGMLVDFGDLKRWMTERIHDPLDHGFAFREDDPIGAALRDVMPDAKLIRLPFIPTAENLAAWCWGALEPLVVEHWRGNLTLVSIELWETPTSKVTYSA